MRALLLHFAQPLVISIYWVSICLIGFALLNSLKDRFGPLLEFKGIKDNIAFIILFSFSLGSLAIGILSIPLYILRAPSLVGLIIYILLALLSLLYIGNILWLRRATLVSRLRLSGENKVILFAFSVLAMALVGDFVTSGIFGTTLANGSDSYVHISRILSISQYGFSLDDGFLRGVVESRYNINVIYSLYIPAIQLFHLLPADAWNSSLGFFRLMQWVAIAAFSYFITRSWLKTDQYKAKLFAVAATIFAIAIYAGTNFKAGYPNIVINLWLILLIIGLSVMISETRKNIGGILLLAASLLIALTHPTYSLMSFMYVTCFAVLMLLAEYTQHRKIELSKKLLYMGASAMILLLSPLFTNFFPDRMTAESFNFGAFDTVKMFGVDVLRIIMPTSVYEWSIFIVISIGYIYLMRELLRRHNVNLVLLVSLLLSFVYLTSYNPFFMALVHSKLPIWVVGRFSAMNALQYVSITLGFYAIYQYVKHKKPQKVYQAFGYGALIVFALTYCISTGVASYRSFYANTKGDDHGYRDFIHRTYDSLYGVIPPGSLVVTPASNAYFLPAVIPVHVIAIDSTHATPVADSDDRLACATKLQSSLFSATDLRIINADYIIIAPWDKYFNENKSILDHQKRFTPIKQTSDFDVYRINKDINNEQATDLELQSPCYKYQKVEGNL